MDRRQQSLWGIAILCVFFQSYEKRKAIHIDTPRINQSLNFKSVPASHSNITFNNEIAENTTFNYFTYPNIYSGGGVSVGDINNDGLVDIYFSGNMVENKLYLNQGDFKFKDITEIAGVAAYSEKLRWPRGVNMVDINNDGFLDIYVCIGDPKDRNANLLYINNGDLTFTEEAKKYGLDDTAHSVQSYFFDYDKDGDLDVYLATYPPFDLQNNNAFFVSKMKHPVKDETDKLYRNDGGYFVDVTDESGISNYGLTLSASIADFNNDDWPDIYVSNDFNSVDYLYLNNGDGTFTDQLKKYLPHTSNFGMGTDVADFNNDGLVDILQCDMMPKSNFDQKTNMSPMNTAQFNNAVTSGLHYQYMRNTLQLNRGNGYFSDIAELAGVAYSDWSWSSLFVDLNNDGWKDIFISNGMRRGVNNNDYLKLAEEIQAAGKVRRDNILSILDLMPVKPIDNYVYINQGGLTFKEQTGNGGLSFKGFTHGVAYADFDNDGDLDLVMNNMDNEAGLFENKATEVFDNANFIKIKLNGGKYNRHGIGASLKITAPDNTIQYQEIMSARGYQSSMQSIAHFGIGFNTTIDNIEVNWSDGKYQLLKNVKANKTITIDYKNSQIKKSIIPDVEYLFEDISNTSGITFKHKENDFDDFQRESLLPHRMSQFGPALSVTDVNNDQLEDFYIGGAMGQSGELYIQMTDGTFQKKKTFKELFNIEEVDALFFDADMDGDQDLIVVSGGNENEEGSLLQQDYFYLNDGQGNFSLHTEIFADTKISGGKIQLLDIEGDGDNDILITGRQIPGKYGYPASTKLYENILETGKLEFKDITKTKAPEFESIGMITSAICKDLNNDGRTDIVLAGEWTEPLIFFNEKDGFKKSNQKSLAEHKGWWFSLAVADFDKDGDIDIIAGNLGENYKYKASPKTPFELYTTDFNANGNLDIVLSFYEENKQYPLRGRECTSNQMPFIKEKFKSYDSFGKAQLEDVYGKEKLSKALHLKASTFTSMYLENDGTGQFNPKPLPVEAQFSTINSIITNDIDGDGNLDIIISGNLYGSEVETPRADASYGLFLKGNGEGDFKSISPKESRLYVMGDVKSSSLITLFGNNTGIIFAKNKNTLQLFKINK